MGALNVTLRPMALLSFLLFALPCIVTAVCPCGFSTTNPANTDETLFFTEMLETDFTKLEDLSDTYAWRAQEFNVSAKVGRGRYGKQFISSNVQAAGKTFEGQGPYVPQNGAGIDLRVNSSLNDEVVPGAELDSVRLDLHWGSYRAGLKATNTNGTCAAFFWYFNDTQEIDMEFLSREFMPEENIWPINLVIHSEESKEAGFDAAKTKTYKKLNLTFDPTADFHEYRFDYLPGRVLFYADSELLAEMTGRDIPSVGGHLILQHWSNGNPNWSGGPPEEDATVTFSYVKAYFNSSDPERMTESSERCQKAEVADRNICVIPQGSQESAVNGEPFFGQDKNGNGVTDADESGAMFAFRQSTTLLAWMVMASVAICLGQF